jgi:hypothetical protein
MDSASRNSGRLVSKDELFGGVWPNVVVTDDTLVQSIGELRREGRGIVVERGTSLSCKIVLRALTFASLLQSWWSRK